MNATLENLTEKVRENRLRNLAINVIKYQDFSTNATIRKIDNAGLSESTLRFYIDKGIGYIKQGTVYKGMNNFNKYIDDGIEKHVQPLTPRNDEKRRPTMRKKQQKPNSPCINPQMAKDVLRQKKQYAVQIGNNIRLLNNLECAKAFADGLSFMGKTDAKIIKIKIEEVNE